MQRFLKGEYAEAEPLYVRSQAIRDKALGLDHLDVAISLNNRAGLLGICSSTFIALTKFLLHCIGAFQRKNGEAESLFKRSLAINENVYGPDHPEVATDLINWAGLLESQVRAIRDECLRGRYLLVEGVYS